MLVATTLHGMLCGHWLCLCSYTSVLRPIVHKAKIISSAPCCVLFDVSMCEEMSSELEYQALTQYIFLFWTISPLYLVHIVPTLSGDVGEEEPWFWAWTHEEIRLKMEETDVEINGWNLCCNACLPKVSDFKYNVLPVTDKKEKSISTHFQWCYNCIYILYIIECLTSLHATCSSE